MPRSHACALRVAAVLALPGMVAACGGSKHETTAAGATPAPLPAATQTSATAQPTDVFQGAVAIEPGDVLVELAGEPLDSVEDLFAALRHHRPGQEVAVGLLRNGARRTVKVQLSAKPTG